MYACVYVCVIICECPNAQNGNPLFFLYVGAVDAIVVDKFGKEKVVAKIQQGRFFGEVGKSAQTVSSDILFSTFVSTQRTACVCVSG